MENDREALYQKFDEVVWRIGVVSDDMSLLEPRSSVWVDLAADLHRLTIELGEVMKWFGKLGSEPQ